MKASEAAAAWGVSLSTAHQMIHLLVRDGKLRAIGIDTAPKTGTAKHGNRPRLYHAADVERIRLERLRHPPQSGGHRRSK